MNKKLKNIVSFSVVLTIGFSAIFCCCLTRTAQAGNSVVEKSCYQQETSQQTGKDTNTADKCECEKNSSFGVDVLIKDVSLLSPVYLTGFLLQQDHFVKRDYVFYNYRQYPPKAPPIYLQNSILRI